MKTALLMIWGLLLKPLLAGALTISLFILLPGCVIFFFLSHPVVFLLWLVWLLGAMAVST